VTVDYLHTDHLNTPRLVTDEQNKILWRSQPLAEPFGNGAPEEDPDGNGIPFAMNLRFPGQYADKESNLNYNYYRDYNPQTGRYIESDPIGLRGGMNTYGYVGGNPLSYRDPRGLDRWGDDPYFKRPPSTGDAITPVCGPECLIPLVWRTVKVVEACKPATPKIPENRAPKIFGDREGHLPDTAANRKLLEEVASDPAASLGKDRFGNDWSARTQPDGTQEWTQARNGEIINGGLNQTPRTFSPETGLSSTVRPGWK
jgi:RHS repeat-associated protein